MNASIGLRTQPLPLHGGHRRVAWVDVGPVRLILGPFGDPALSSSFWAAVSFLVDFVGRHQLVGSSLRMRATSSLSSGLPGTIASLARAVVAVVEAELGLAVLLVGTVAEEAVLGEDRPDVAVELHLLARPRGARGEGEDPQDNERIENQAMRPPSDPPAYPDPPPEGHTVQSWEVSGSHGPCAP